MKLHEVLSLPEVLSGEKWFRPAGFPGGFGYMVKEGGVYSVPSVRGGDPGITHDVSTLAGDWEVVMPAEAMRATK